MKGSLIALLVLAVGLASDSLNIVDKVSNYYIKQNTTKEIELTKMFHYTNMEKMLNNMSEQMLLNMKLNNPELWSGNLNSYTFFHNSKQPFLFVT